MLHATSDRHEHFAEVFRVMLQAAFAPWLYRPCTTPQASTSYTDQGGNAPGARLCPNMKVPTFPCDDGQHTHLHGCQTKKDHTKLQNQALPRKEAAALRKVPTPVIPPHIVPWNGNDLTCSNKGFALSLPYCVSACYSALHNTNMPNSLPLHISLSASGA